MTKKGGYSNPALQALGLPKLRLPSRNWSIFLGITGGIAGLVVYDKRERTKIKEQWKQRVAHLATEHMDPMAMPRKVTIYCAPPPEDYIDKTMQHFRNYIKPILTASATDFVVKSSSRQGELRYMVAEEIRDQRRKMEGLPTGEEGSDELDNKINDKLSYDTTGGVICVGRGAYKEYMNGLHEGWLGPLEPPAEPAPTPEVQEFPNEEEDLKDVMGEKPEKEDKDRPEEDKKEEKAPVPAPYTELGQWGDLPTNDAFARATAAGSVATVIQAVTFPHILGFLNTPVRMYRFFTQRYVADEVCGQTVAAILANTRPATKQDADLLVENEDDWAQKWKQTGIDKKSEWMAEFKLDDRIVNNVQVYELPEDKQ